MENIDTSCVLCGSIEDTHPCANDYKCDRCCMKIIDAPNKFSDWMDTVVVPYITQQKHNRKNNK